MTHFWHFFGIIPSHYVLRVFHSALPTEVHADTSAKGIVDVFAQIDHPVTYAVHSFVANSRYISMESWQFKRCRISKFISRMFIYCRQFFI